MEIRSKIKYSWGWLTGLFNRKKRRSIRVNGLISNPCDDVMNRYKISTYDIVGNPGFSEARFERKVPLLDPIRQKKRV